MMHRIRACSRKEQVLHAHAQLKIQQNCGFPIFFQLSRMFEFFPLSNLPVTSNSEESKCFAWKRQAQELLSLHRPIESVRAISAMHTLVLSKCFGSLVLNAHS
jgi:hypothetical protein